MSVLGSDPPPHLPEDVRLVWVELVAGGLDPGPGFEAYCGQVARMRDARQRVSDEGLVVMDAKGQPIPHPALRIELEAQAAIRLWLANASLVGAAEKRGVSVLDELASRRRAGVSDAEAASATPGDRVRRR